VELRNVECAGRVRQVDQARGRDAAGTGERLGHTRTGVGASEDSRAGTVLLDEPEIIPPKLKTSERLMTKTRLLLTSPVIEPLVTLLPSWSVPVLKVVREHSDVGRQNESAASNHSCSQRRPSAP
jgi:hypothetical protein